MMDYFDAYSGLFTTVYVLMLGVAAVNAYLGARRAEAPFRVTAPAPIRFRERRASGRSMRSALTRLGGARRALDVVVTDQELWIKGIWAVFSYIGTMYDLTHKVPLTRIKRVVSRGPRVEVWFSDSSARECHVELELKDPEGFVAAVAPGR